MFLKLLILVAINMTLLNSLAVHASDKDWNLEKKKEGIRVYSKSVDGSSIKAVRGVTTLRSSLNRIVSILHKPELRPSWDDLCGESYLYKSINQTQDLVYIHTKLPWPVKDRDMLTKVTWSQDPDSLAVSMESNATDKLMPNKKGRVRVTIASNNWLLTPLGDGQVEVITTAHFDPAGPLPAWLLNTLSVESPFSILNSIKRIVKDDSFEHQEFDFIHEPN